MKYSPAWLAKSRPERNAFNARHIHPILAKYGDRVSMRWFDAEAFNARFTNFALFETSDLKVYYHLIEALRDTPFITEGLAEFEDLFMGVEWGHRAFEAEQAPRT